MTAFGDLPDNHDLPNGPTIREANHTRQHKIPIGTLVEVKYDRWFGDGACVKVHARLYVFEYGRDCDGTPLYTLAGKTYEDVTYILADLGTRNPSKIQVQFVAGLIEHGFSEESLTVVEVTNNIKKGFDCLEWNNE